METPRFVASSVELRLRDEPHCRGVMIARQVVLTAAHCLTDGVRKHAVDAVEVCSGAGCQRAVRLVPHPEFPAGDFDSPFGAGREEDIGLLLLAGHPGSRVEGVLLGGIPSPAVLWSDTGQRLVVRERSAYEALTSEPEGPPCSGSSGAGVWAERGRRTLVGVVARGSDLERPCGGGMIVTLVGPRRGWIDATLERQAP